MIEVPPGDTSIWKNWGIEIKDPEGNAVFSKGGGSLQYNFSFTVLKTGYYWIELWNSGYTKVVELQIEPSEWESIGGEHESRGVSVAEHQSLNLVGSLSASDNCLGG